VKDEKLDKSMKISLCESVRVRQCVCEREREREREKERKRE